MEIEKIEETESYAIEAMKNAKFMGEAKHDNEHFFVLLNNKEIVEEEN